MSTEHTTGIILHVLDFQDEDQIVTLFSQDRGLMKFVVKRSWVKARKNPKISSLSLVEVSFFPSKNELYSTRDFTIIDTFFSLRKDFNKLNAACDFVRAIKASQLALKPAPHLYQLLIRYLEKLKKSSNFSSLLASFYLKTLKHEGVFKPVDRCSVCLTLKSKLFIISGEPYCSEHTLNKDLFFMADEMSLIKILTESRSFEMITSTNTSVDTLDKIRKLFFTFYVT